MRSPRSLTARAAAALALAAALTLGSAPAHASLLPEASLDKPNASGEWPVGWGRAKNVTWESEAGNFFLRLASPAPGTHVNLYHRADLPANTTGLDLSFRARVTDLMVGTEKWYDARIIVNFRTAEGKVISAPKIPYFSRDTAGWQTVVHQIPVPAGAVSVEVMPSLFRAAAGTFDIDDLALKPVVTTR
jgi:endoglucanase